MKILQIIDKLEIGGAERVFVDVSNLLHRNNINVSILTFKKGGPLEYLLDRKIPFIKFTRSQKYNLYNAYKLSCILRDYDILHIHMRHVYRYVKLVSLFFRVKSKIILHDHYGKILIDNTVPLFFDNMLKPNYYIGVSDDLISWGSQKLNVKYVFKLSNIIIKESNSVLHTQKKEGIVMVANIKPIKNQLFAIRLAAFLNKKLTIVGNIQDTIYYETLLNEITRLEYQNNITFLNNIHDIQKVLPRFELGIMPSKSESGPLVLIEFLAQNLPFIAYNTGEVSKLLKYDLPNFFIDNFELSNWQQRIFKIINGKYSFKEIFDKYFSEKQYINQCLNIYQKVKNS